MNQKKRHTNELIRAVGVSRGTVSQDLEVGTAGLKSIDASANLCRAMHSGRPVQEKNTRMCNKDRRWYLMTKRQMEDEQGNIRSSVLSPLLADLLEHFLRMLPNLISRPIGSHTHLLLTRTRRRSVPRQVIVPTSLHIVRAQSHVLDTF